MLTGTISVAQGGEFSGIISLETGDNAIAFGAGGRDDLAALHGGTRPLDVR